MLKSLNYFLFFIIALLTIPAAAQQTTRTTTDKIMILPFENTSTDAAFNWVGESFAESLTDLFQRPQISGAGLRVISNDERKNYQQRLRVPLTTLPSLATAIKLAKESNSTLLVLGKYSVTPAQGDIATNLRVTARVVRVQDGMFLTEKIGDRSIMREIDLADAIAKLQTLQGQVAHQILYQREGNSLALSQKEIVSIAEIVPPRAFEAYTKAMLTSDSKTTENGEPARANFLKNALRLYAAEKNNEIYANAALELGHFYLRQNNFQTAAENFSKLLPTDYHYAEAAFYHGLTQWNLSNAESALTIFRALAENTKLTAAYNNVGATALHIALNDKKVENRDERVEEGLKFLQEAAKSAPDDEVAKFNHGYALFAARRYKEASAIFREYLVSQPKDGQAYFLLSKSLEKAADATAVEVDNQARRFLPNYAKTQTEWQKSATTGDIPFRLFKNFNRSDYLNLTRGKDAPNVNSAETEWQNKIAKARQLYQEGRDDEALTELRQMLVKDSMNAESYLLIGQIYLRRADLDAAVSNLKTAIFWKNDLIDGHIALGKIFLERGDFNQAMTYAQNALQIDQNNPEAIALERLVKRQTK